MFLRVSDVSVDPQLIERVPYRLATYYAALPVAREDGQVSVVMATPESTMARTLLGNLLQAPIVPIRGVPADIRAAIDRVYPQQQEGVRSSDVLAWSATSSRWPAVCRVAATWAAARGGAVTTLGEAGGADVGDVLAHTRTNEHGLLVIHAPDREAYRVLLQDSAAPFVLVRGNHTPLDTMLVVLRGYYADEHVLDQAAALAHHGTTAVTFMPLTTRAPAGASAGLRAVSQARACIERFAGRFDGISMRLKRRQGDPVTQIVDELRDGAYDLWAIAAEGYGEFVEEVLWAVEQSNVHPERPILVVTPDTQPIP